MVKCATRSVMTRDAHSYEYDNNGNILYVNTLRLKTYMTASSDKIGFNIYSALEMEQTELNGGTPVPYGTMPIEFLVKASNPIGPPIINSSGNDDNSVDLSASQVSVNSVCSWYNRGVFMGSGTEIHLAEEQATSVVQLITIDNENGYVGQAFVNLDELVTVSHIGFTNNGNVEVALTKPASQNLSVQAVSTLTGNVVATGQIVAGNASLQLPASVWANGTYLVSVINGSTIIRTVQLMKQ